MRITDLPTARTLAVRGIQTLARTAVGSGSNVYAELLDQARIMQAAELFWVTPEMTEVARDAATDLPPWSVTQMIPTEIGLLIYEGDMPQLPYYPTEPAQERTDSFGRKIQPHTQVDWLMWRRVGRGLQVTYGCWAQRMSQEGVVTGSIPLVPMGMVEVFDTERLNDMASNFPGHGDDPDWETKNSLFNILGATWAMMRQETVSRLNPQPIGHRDGARKLKPVMVTTITLRRMKQVNAERDASGRVLTHRFLVRGHWRQQACGPNYSERRPTWVPTYIKGPEGAPLLVRERVTVWRR